MLHIDVFFRVVVCALYLVMLASTFVCLLAFFGLGFAALGSLVESIVPLVCIVTLLTRIDHGD